MMLQNHGQQKFSLIVRLKQNLDQKPFLLIDSKKIWPFQLVRTEQSQPMSRPRIQEPQPEYYILSILLNNLLYAIIMINAQSVMGLIQLLVMCVQVLRNKDLLKELIQEIVIVLMVIFSMIRPKIAKNVSNVKVVLN